MKHWGVRAKAIGAKAEAFHWFGGSVGAMWRVLLIALVGGGLGTVVALMNGLDLVRDAAAVGDYTTRFALIVLVIVVVPAGVIRLIANLLPCSSTQLTTAYEDDTLPRWVRAYAASHLRDEALARGADGWAAIWEERRAKL